MSKKHLPPPQNLEEKHPVSLLGEIAAKRKWLQPCYISIESGPQHKKVFNFKVNLNNREYLPPENAVSKKLAKAMAAKYCLQEIGILPKSQGQEQPLPV